METPMYMEDFFASLGLIGILLAVVILVFYVWSIVWAYRDANSRGKPGWLVAVMVALLSWPVGLLMWLVFRPTISHSLNE